MLGDLELAVTEGDGKSRYVGKGDVAREDDGDPDRCGITIFGSCFALGTNRGEFLGESVPCREGARGTK